MGFDKEDSKGGRRKVGGFLQLFDWTAKSRKKLFATKSDSPEFSKQGKRFDGNLPMRRLHLINEDESGTSSNFRGSSDHSCTSSVADDEGYGVRAPGVVARLMGLDSLPTSSLSEPFSTPYFDTQSILETQYQRENVNYHRDHQTLYSGDLLHKVGGSARKIEELKRQKILNRPIEKFQTEVLPPKSAKTIPVTHHKLLSPIKSAGFIPSKNAAYIMEAAAKIIEPGPQVTTRAKTSVLTASPMSIKVRELKEKMEASQKGRVSGSTSLNFRMREMKEKVEASNKTARPLETHQRTAESNTVKYLKGQSLNKSWNGPDDTSFRVHVESEEGHGLKNKGKSISLAVQAKVNVQRREGLNSGCNRSLGGQKEQLESKPVTLIKNQPHGQKNAQRKSSGHNACGVLRQNNQKQNSVMDKDKLPSKSSISKAQGRKVLHGDSPYGRQKNTAKSATNVKGGSWKQASEITDSEKEVLYSCTNHFPRKKRSLDRDFQRGRDQSADNMKEKSPKPGPSNDIISNRMNWLNDSKKNGSDVISFTFTTPLVQTNPASEISGPDVLSMDDRVKRVLIEPEHATSSPVTYNIFKGDALSMLLEQKLRELTNGFQPAHDDIFREGATMSIASNLEDRMPSCHLDNMLSKSLHNKYQNASTADLSLTKAASEFSSVGQDYRVTVAPQTIDRMNLQKMNHIEGLFPNCRYPSPISVLEPSFSTESCGSSASTETNYTAGSELLSSIQAQEIVGSAFPLKLNSVNTDTELLDSASSVSIQSGGYNQLSPESGELEFMKDILSNVEVMFNDFACGKTLRIISPDLFNMLENCKSMFQADGSEYRLRSKLMFDCVCECLDLRLSPYAGGGYRMWAKGVATVRRKELLAGQVYKDLSGWRAIGDSMVDELVDDDMSTPYGKWQDFDVDAFDLGIEVGHQIFNSLVDEALVDILRI